MFITARWKLVLPVLCLLIIAAGDPPAGEALLRQGDDAFQRRDFAAALDAFTRAQPLVGEPGVAAFNRAAAHFRLKQFPEAADAYRQALADAQLPATLRVRAWYDLGNSLLAVAADRPRLEDAMAAYRACLAGDPDATLRPDVEHNLEVAAWRWLKAQPPKTDPGNDPTSSNEPKTNKDGTPDSKTPKLTPTGKPEDNKVQYTDQKTPPGPDGDKKAASIGEVKVLEDTADLRPLSPADAARTAAHHAERIAEERRRERSPRERPMPQGKDW